MISLAPLAQGVGNDGNALVLAINDRLRRISAALPTPVTPAASGGPIATTAPTTGTGAYGFTEAQAAQIVALLNKIEAALVANGIMS